MDTDLIQQRLSELTRAHGVPGAQFAVHRHGRTWTCAVGEASTGTPLTDDAAVPIGSITKTFTATVVMALVSDGDLELDAPLSDHLPELRRVASDLGTQLTARHLLSHTGGLPSDPEDAHGTSLRRHVLEAFRTLEPLHRPGAGFSYSNIGYVLLGHLIEVLTGMSWWEAVDSVLLRPLGVPARFTVGPGADPAVVPGHAVHPRTRRVVPVRQSLALVDAPAGALAASATDLLALGRMLGGGAPPLVAPEDLVLMRTPVRHAEPFGMADGWGLGMALWQRDGSTWVGHDGNGDGTSCHLRINPEDGTVVALTTNGSSGLPLWRRLVPELAEAGVPVGDYDGFRNLARRIPPPPDCTGSFLNGDTEYAVRAADREHLVLTVDGEPFADLSLFDGLVFAMRDSDTGDTSQTGRFLRNPRDGGIEWIQIGGRLARRQVPEMA
ncbi:CubicO group peptidase (beta-lactamase class C family) [Saccharothrix coeruleofusca]|uniref:serine hydrolase domain-containing protein n=1 Tax=Saccharothrix coeruleofusca TaxID=33919 RepID=UPI001AE0FCFD|nr:serine hydrolase domain-containing protein [Saccharothrix coeruleofusca]MBP2336951.1 CubicO group peptidase (beta-lactamase class C family) [Saccharothrix coeruleofusca]